MLGVNEHTAGDAATIAPPPPPRTDPQSTAGKWQQAVQDAAAPPAQTVAGTPPSHGALADAWDWTKQQATTAGHAIGEFDEHNHHVLTRAAGAAQAVGGGLEAVAGAATAGIGGAATATGVGAAPGIPAMVGGGLLAVNGADNAVAGLRTAITGQFHHTLTSQAAGATAHALGASDKTADRITNGVDLAQGVAGGGASLAAGAMRKTATTALEHAGQLAGDAAHAAPHVAPEAAHAASSATHTAQTAHATAEARALTAAEHAAPAASGTSHAAEAARYGRTEAEFEALAKDPAHNGKISPASEQERKVGLDLEQRGAVPGPLTREPTGAAEFIDGKGQKWDVKGFNSNFAPKKGGFSLMRDADKVDKSIAAGEHVMLDTAKMTPQHIAELRAEGAARGWGSKVAWHP